MDKHWWDVATWPRWLRRLFVVTFLVSGPLYAVCYIILGTLFYLAIVPITIVNTLVGNYWEDPPPYKPDPEAG